MNGKNIIGDLMKLDKNTRLCIFGGLAIGFLNGLLGAGGGIVAVPILHKIINNRKCVVQSFVQCLVARHNSYSLYIKLI